MNTNMLWIAAVVGFITFIVHTFVGGPRVAAPLLQDKSLPKASKWLNYYCWHITTLYTFAIGGVFAYAAMNPNTVELIIFVNLLNTAFAILSITVALKAHINPFRFPSTSLFSALSLFGLMSVVA